MKNMLNEKEIINLREFEQQLLKAIRLKFGKIFQIDETLSDNILYIRLLSPSTENHLEIFYNKDDIVLSVGKWTHCHPTPLDELIEKIEKITKEKIIVWKVTRPDGHWYSGHYDIDEWKENLTMVDEPDTNIEKGDRIEKATFKSILEDKFIE